MQGIYAYIPETNYVPREYSVAAILLFILRVLISLVSVLNLLYFYIRWPAVVRYVNWTASRVFASVCSIELSLFLSGKLRRRPALCRLFRQHYTLRWIQILRRVLPKYATM